MTFPGVIYCEGDFGDVVSFATAAERAAYHRGLSTGANMYGAGSCTLYTLDDPDEVPESRRELVRKYLEPTPTDAEIVAATEPEFLPPQGEQ